MTMRNFGRLLLVIICTALVAGCVGGLRPIPRIEPEAEQHVMPDPVWLGACDSTIWRTDHLELRRESAPEQRLAAFRDGRPFIADQLILSGSRSAIETVVGRTMQRFDVRLTPELALWESLEDERATARDSDDDRFVIQLFRIEGAASARTDIWRLIHSIRNISIQTGELVFVDPNYLISLPHVTSANGRESERGDPDPSSPAAGIGSGSTPFNSSAALTNPLSGEASPLSGEASPFAVPSRAALPVEFWGQWALADINQGGIALTADGARSPNLGDGSGVNIVVLDTSPLPTPESSASMANIGSPLSWSYVWYTRWTSHHGPRRSQQPGLWTGYLIMDSSSPVWPMRWPLRATFIWCGFSTPRGWANWLRSSLPCRLLTVPICSGQS
jgi:hypothetical protein